MSYLATRFKVDSNIPIINKHFSVEARTRDFSIALQGHAGTVKSHTCIEYINIVIVQQTCAILDDCQRLHYR